MTHDKNNWPELNQLIGICFNEDMLELYPAETFEQSVEAALRCYIAHVRLCRIRQARDDIRSILGQIDREDDLQAILRNMGNAWDFSPHHAFLNTVVIMLEAALGAPPNADDAMHCPSAEKGSQHPPSSDVSQSSRQRKSPHWSIGQCFLVTGLFGATVVPLIYITQRESVATHVPQGTPHAELPKGSLASVRKQIQGKWYWESGGYIKIRNNGQCLLGEGETKDDPDELKTSCRLIDDKHFGLAFPDSWDSGQLAQFEIAELDHNTLRLVRENDTRVLHRVANTMDIPSADHVPEPATEYGKWYWANSRAGSFVIIDQNERCIGGVESPETDTHPHESPIECRVGKPGQLALEVKGCPELGDLATYDISELSATRMTLLRPGDTEVLLRRAPDERTQLFPGAHPEAQTNCTQWIGDIEVTKR